MTNRLSTIATELPTETIVVAPQIRKSFDPKAQDELTESIRRVGILQNLLVKIAVNEAGEEYYQLIAGERRLRSAKAVGLTSVPVRVMAHIREDDTDVQMIENIQREQLELEEIAAGVDAIYKKTGNMEETATMLSKSKPWVSKMVAVHNRLGKYALELLGGGFTKDIELLTVLSRAEELENAWPRVEIITEAIKEKKAGRAEVIALHDELKKELEESVDGEDAEDAEPDMPNFFAGVDAIHTRLKEQLNLIDAKEKPESMKKLIKDTVRAYQAHWMDVVKNMAEYGANSPS